MIDISSKHSEELLKAMCKHIGVDPDTVDWEDREWFLQHTWTEKQQEEFLEYVANFLIKNKYTKLGKEYALRKARSFVANYGWKTIKE